MTAKPIFIADGHHRYETACNYRDELAAGGTLPAAHPANFVLMMCVGMSDPGHDRAADAPAVSRAAAADQRATWPKSWATCFTTRIAGQGIDRAAAVWDEIEMEGDQGTLGLFTAADKTWMLATDHRRGPSADGRSRRRPQRRLAGTGREPPAPAGRRYSASSAGPAQAAVRPPGRGSGRVPGGGRRGRVSPGRPGHARHGRRTSRRSASTASGCRPRARTSIPSCSAAW